MNDDVVDQICRAHILTHNMSWLHLWPFNERSEIDWSAVLQALREQHRLSYPKPRPSSCRVRFKRQFYEKIMPAIMMIAGPEHRNHDLSRTEAAKIIMNFRSVVYHSDGQFVRDAQEAYFALLAKFSCIEDHSHEAS